MKKAFVLLKRYDSYPWPAVERGFARLGFEARQDYSEPGDGDVFATWTPWSESIAGFVLQQHRDRTIVFENGYIPTDAAGTPYYLAGRGGFHAVPGSTHANERSPGDRWARMGLRIEDRRAAEDGVILCVGQRGHVDDRWSMPIGYARKLVETAHQRFPDREIIFRPHPQRWNHALTFDARVEPWLTIDRGSAEQAIARAAIVMSWNSKMLCEAVRRGRTAIYIAKHHILSRLENRAQFFRDLAYAQWTADEIATGEPMARLLAAP